MKTIKILFIILILPVALFAQRATLKGKIVDAVSNEPLPFVNVIVSGTTIGTTTDLDGNFTLTGLTTGLSALKLHLWVINRPFRLKLKLLLLTQIPSK